MSNWTAKAEEILTSIGLPFDFERYKSDGEQLPDTFIVYFLVDDSGKTWADGKETSKSTRIQVSLFFKKKSIYQTIPDQIETTFIQGGFLRVGSGRIPYSESTEHYGWRCDFRYYEGRN